MDEIVTPETIEIKNEGPFILGCEGGNYEERPEQQIELSTYYIGKYPVTNLEYSEFLKATGHRFPYKSTNWAINYNWNDDNPPNGREKHPVVLVSYHDALAYCAWLNTNKEVMKTTPDDFYYRLPTEAEWEKAASWGPSKVFEKRRRFPWGDDWDTNKCNCFEKLTGPNKQFRDLAEWIQWWNREQQNLDNMEYCLDAVDKYPLGQSRYGIYDLVGNTWEWCIDSWSTEVYHNYILSRNPCRTNPDIMYVTRGAAWPYHPNKRWVTQRNNPLPPDFQGNWTGFRIALAKCHNLTSSDYQSNFFDALGPLYNQERWIRDTEDREFLSDQEIVSIVFLDIDHFKKINDTYGHRPAGDSVLSSLFNLIADSIGQRINTKFTRGLAYRAGGEEIAIVLPNYSKEEATAYAERLRKEWKSKEHTAQKLGTDEYEKFNCTASFGVAARYKTSISISKLIKDADTAMYKSKDAGRDRVISI